MSIFLLTNLLRLPVDVDVDHLYEVTWDDGQDARYQFVYFCIAHRAGVPPVLAMQVKAGNGKPGTDMFPCLLVRRLPDHLDTRILAACDEDEVNSAGSGSGSGSTSAAQLSFASPFASPRLIALFALYRHFDKLGMYVGKGKLTFPILCSYLLRVSLPAEHGVFTYAIFSSDDLAYSALDSEEELSESRIAAFAAMQLDAYAQVECPFAW